MGTFVSDHCDVHQHVPSRQLTEVCGVYDRTPSFAESPAAHAYFSFVLPMLKQLNSSVVFLETISAKDEFRSVADVYRDTEKVLTTMAKTVAKVRGQNCTGLHPRRPVCRAMTDPDLQLFFLEH